MCRHFLININFLDSGKTERECATYIVEQAKKHGFIDFDEVRKKDAVVQGSALKKGDKIYYKHKEKAVILAVLGADLQDGMNIIGAHIDSPRLDLKQIPLYEDSSITYFKTHYYGGVKIPLGNNSPLLYTVLFTQKKAKVLINIGDAPNDPVFFINDLLIHLSKKQLQEKIRRSVPANSLTS